MIGPYYVGDMPRDSIDVFITRDGEPVSLSGYDAARVELEDPSGVLVDTNAVTAILMGDRVALTWPTSDSLFTTPGVYTMQVLLQVGATQEQRAATISFEVRARADARLESWATLTDVMTLTGVAVDSPVLLQSQGLIEMLTGLAYEDTLDQRIIILSPRDKRQLKRAVAYQAAFMAQNDSLFSRPGVLSFNQDGFSMTTSMRGAGGGVDETALTIAPLAKMALKGLSWKSATKTERVGHDRRAQHGYGYLKDYANAWMRDDGYESHDGWTTIDTRMGGRY